MRPYRSLAIVTLLLGGLFVPAVQAAPQISVQIGPSAMMRSGVPFAPNAGYVWRPGHYIWTDVGYRWIAGTWMPRSYARWGLERQRFERERRDWDRDEWRDRDDRGRDGWRDRDGRDWDRDRDPNDRDRRDWRR